MDTNNSSQNQQQGSGQKPGLSWSQPNMPQNNTPKTPVQPTTPPKTPTTPVGTPDSSGGGKRVAWVLGILIVCALIALMVIGLHGKKTDDTSNMTATTTPDLSETDASSSAADSSTSPVAGSVTVDSIQGLVVPSPQDAGLEVALNSIAVSEPTWVVVYENHNGQPGNILGAALFLKDTQNALVSLLRGTLPGQTYFVGESHDDGDRVYSLRLDAAVRDENGNPTLVQFKTN